MDVDVDANVVSGGVGTFTVSTDDVGGLFEDDIIIVCGVGISEGDDASDVSWHGLFGGQ